ncbi:hypothetical protein KI387_041097 [Taxus chinensis]|uniref:Glycosyltransferase n=1 Tax=Taxus chinensis TaxID=29808 RepID=A0AA38CAK2_TAXCH|nr:hypothetical protein KI387_041097 [Taxus chinensis]
MSPSDPKIGISQSHAILIPLPIQGHINPMMQLAWKLVSHGFLITFVNTETNHQRIIKANKDQSLHDSSDMIRMVSVADGLAPDDSHSFVVKFFAEVENALGPSVIDKLIRNINEKEGDQKVSCIVADVWTCFGLHTVAKLHHISLAVFNTSLVSNFAIRYFSPKLVSLGILPSDGIPKEDKTKKYLSSLPPLKSAHLPWLYGGEDMFRHAIRMVKEINKIEWVIFNTFYEQEPVVLDELSKEMSVFPIGPLISPDFLDGDRNTERRLVPSLLKPEAECLEWLEKQAEQSVIYVSFGSYAALNKLQMEELSVALEATHRPFLWVVRSDTMDSCQSVFSPGFMERIIDRGCIVSWAPQLRVLSHPAIACFVTHCGWNSVQESITMGVPMLCWPYFADQFLNSTYIVDVWKVGLALNANNNGLIEREEFTKAIERLLVAEEGTAIREEMRKMNKIARDTVKEGGSSSNNFKLFLNAITKRVNC